MHDDKMNDWGPLLLSFKVALIVAPLTLVVGVGWAWLLSWKKLWGRELFDALLSTPLILPPTVLGYYLLVMLGERSAIGQAWRSLTGTSIVFTFNGCVVAAAIGALPLVIKPARTAIEAVPPTLIAAARTLGAGPARVFFTVTLPLAARGIVAGGMLCFAKSLGDFGATLMVAGNIPGETQTAALKIYDDVQAGRDYDAFANTAVLTVIAIAALWIANLLSRPRV